MNVLLLMTLVVVVIMTWHDGGGVVGTSVEYEFEGSGASSQSLLWNIFAFVYRGVDPTSVINYVPSSSGAGVTDMTKRYVKSQFFFHFLFCQFVCFNEEVLQ